MRLFGLHDPAPLDRPAPLDAPPRTDPIPPRARRAQHDADNVTTFLLGSAALREQRLRTTAEVWERDAGA